MASKGVRDDGGMGEIEGKLRGKRIANQALRPLKGFPFLLNVKKSVKGKSGF